MVLVPRVPTYDEFQVTPNTLPQSRLTMPEMPDIAGQQADRMGRAMSGAGRDISRIALDVQQNADQLRIDDALNRVKEASLYLTHDKEAGFTNLKGLNALDRPGGMALADEYSENLKKRIEEIQSTLGNDVQRQAFQAQAGGILVSMKGNVFRHESQELKNYGLSVVEGVQNTAVREIQLNWNNPEVTDKAIIRIQAESYRQAQLLGKSAEWQAAHARTLTSGAHKTALIAALENNDPDYAESYLKKYAQQMEGDDILFVRGHITKEQDNKVGFQAASDVMRKVQIDSAGGDIGRAFNILLGTESGNRQFDANGGPLTSSAGAVGIAQVMPGTGPEAAKLAGLPWDEGRFKNDAEYNKALGRAYFNEALRINSGDLSKSYAAYNAGQGRLNQAIKKAEKQGGAWLDFMPLETRKYVTKNINEFQSGGGQAKRATFEDLDGKLRADPRLNESPSRYKAARESLERQFDAHQKAIKQKQDDAYAEGLKWIVGQNGLGRYSEMPFQMRANIDPKDVDSLISFSQKLSKGDDITSENAYFKYMNKPESFAKMSDAEFFRWRTSFSDGDWKNIVHDRAKRLGVSTTASTPGDINSSFVKQTADIRLRQLNLDPTPKDGTKDAERIGGIYKSLNDYVLEAQREAGKKFNDAELTQHIDRFFSKNVKKEGFFSDSSGPMVTQRLGTIPKKERKEIEAALRRGGNESPTEGQVMEIYFKHNLAKNE